MRVNGNRGSSGRGAPLQPPLKSVANVVSLPFCAPWEATEMEIFVNTEGSSGGINRVFDGEQEWIGNLAEIARVPCAS